MTHTVFCQKYQQELEGLARPPYPGEKGQRIFNQVSKRAWQEWLHHQTMLINEKRLNVLDPNTQNYHGEQLEKFLTNQPFDRAEGYTPKNTDVS